MLIQAAIEDHKTWLTWLPVGVLLASLVSGTFGVGALVLLVVYLCRFYYSILMGIWRHHSTCNFRNYTYGCAYTVHC